MSLLRGFSFWLPWPPSLNAYWDRTPKRGVVLSAKGTIYRREVVKALGAQRSVLPTNKLTTRLGVQISGYAPDLRARDVDNWAKPTLDAIEAAGLVFLNDNQIDVCIAGRGALSRRAGYLSIVVEDFGEEFCLQNFFAQFTRTG